ncbi:MAG: sigma-70 family RNA polymerase sigma factor [Thermodesulfovibrionales bacterium]
MKQQSMLVTSGGEEPWDVWLRIEPKVKKYCFSRWGEHGEDVLSDTMVLFCEQYDCNYQDGQAVVFARLKSREAARNLGLYRETLSLDDIVGSEFEDHSNINVFQAYEQTERAEIIAKAISVLSKPHKKIINLRYWQEKTVKKTAQTIGISPSTAHRKEKKALKLLKRNLKKSNIIECDLR